MKDETLLKRRNPDSFKLVAGSRVTKMGPRGKNCGISDVSYVYIGGATANTNVSLIKQTCDFYVLASGSLFPLEVVYFILFYDQL